LILEKVSIVEEEMFNLREIAVAVAAEQTLSENSTSHSRSNRGKDGKHHASEDNHHHVLSYADKMNIVNAEVEHRLQIKQASFVANQKLAIMADVAGLNGKHRYVDLEV
jgi:hypothetical protein